MNVANDIYSKALGLPSDQREELAILLWESLPENGGSPSLHPHYEAEVMRRIEEIDSGNAKMLTLEEVMAKLRKSSSAQSSP
jgi:putative addiction module component (TIGR02574 family)